MIGGAWQWKSYRKFVDNLSGAWNFVNSNRGGRISDQSLFRECFRKALQQILFA